MEENEKEEKKVFIFSEELKKHPEKYVAYEKGTLALKDILGGEQ